MKPLLAILSPILLLGLTSCSSSSGPESCPVGTQLEVPVVVTVVDAATGAPICDAFITRKGSLYCTWNDACQCVGPVGASSNVLTASSRGYTTGVVTITYTAEHSGCTLRNVGTIGLSKGGPDVGCSHRDGDSCADHRVCYSAPFEPGCTDTGETSADPSAKYCCK